MPGKMLAHIFIGCFEPLAVGALLLGVPWSICKLRVRGQRTAIIAAWGIVLLMCCWRVFYAGASKRYIYMLIFPCVAVIALALRDLVFSKSFQPWARIAAAVSFSVLIAFCLVKCFRFNPYDGSIRDGCAVVRQVRHEKKFPLAIVSDKEIERVRYYTGIPCIKDKAIKSGPLTSAKLSMLQKKYAQAADIIFVVLKSPVGEWKKAEVLPDGAEIVFQNYVDRKRTKYFTVIALKTEIVPEAISADDRGPTIFSSVFEPDGTQKIKPFKDNLVNRGLTFFYNSKLEWPNNWIPAVPGEVLFSSQSAAEVELIGVSGGGRRALRMKSVRPIGMQYMRNFDFRGAMNIRIAADGAPGSRFILKVLDLNEKSQYHGVRQEKIFLIVNNREEQFNCFVPASPKRFRFAIELLHGEIIIRDIKIYTANGSGSPNSARPSVVHVSK